LFSAHVDLWRVPGSLARNGAPSAFGAALDNTALVVAPTAAFGPEK
jgi:hypothetical protein